MKSLSPEDIVLLFQLLQIAHEGHLGVVKFKCCLDTVWWPGIDQEIELLDPESEARLVNKQACQLLFSTSITTSVTGHSLGTHSGGSMGRAPWCTSTLQIPCCGLQSSFKVSRSILRISTYPVTNYSHRLHVFLLGSATCYHNR